MSAKWRALQHRHRYTYTAVVFPPPFVEALIRLPPAAASLKFFSELNELIALNSIYTQVNAVKNVAAAFAEFLAAAGTDTAAVSLVSRLYLEILFLENSLPLHRTLIAVFAKNRKFLPEICQSFRLLCEEYSELGGKGKRFSVCRAALSVLSYPKLGFMVDVIGECAVSVARYIDLALRCIVSEINGGSRLSPVVMEQCQEAMSCLYYLLQRFPSKFLEEEAKQRYLDSGELSIFENVLEVILSVLKSSSFSRDCLVASGVSFFAALQVCVGPEELAGLIVKAFFCRPGCSYCFSSHNGFEEDVNIPYNGNLCSEIGNISALSKLCLLRGMLTAVPRTVLNMHFVASECGMTDNMVWTILFDGILPELLNYCENPIDSHFNFHSLTVTQICLQQIKASLLANLTDFSGGYDPLSEAVTNRLLRIVWNNLEDPLNQTVKQVHLVFDLLVDSLSTLQFLKGYKAGPFLQNTAGHLLKLGARCKGRYVPLASLTKRLGAKTILQMCPNLLFETAHAYIDDDVCCAATSFLKCFLECLRDECWSSEGIDKGYTAFRALSLPPILYGLVSGQSRLRTNLNTYALPVILNVDVDSIFPMLSFISVRQSAEEKEITYPELSGANICLRVEQNVAALVSLLKVSRSVALIDGDIERFDDLSKRENGYDSMRANNFAIICVKGINVEIPVEWLILALTHGDETLRIDAAESLFLNPKTSSLPSSLELSLMKEAVPLNMRCSSTAFQMKWTSLFKKFFSRVRTALERQIKLGLWSPDTCVEGTKHVLDNEKKIVVRRAEDLFCFMKWLSCYLFFSCYPSAPYERKTMATELILIMINAWPLIPHSHAEKGGLMSPYSGGFTLPDSTLLLVGSIVDSWDRLRENSFQILSRFPTPLPGISNEESIKRIIAWAKKLICSPRVRESDAGALTLRLIFRKYVMDLGWMIGVSFEINCLRPQTTGYLSRSISRIPVIQYLFALIDWLQVVVEEGEKDLSKACKNSFVHGVLLTLRYSFEELDWNSEVMMSNSSAMKVVLEKLLDLVRRITSLALWVVSADAWCLPEEMDDALDDDTANFSDVPDEMYLPDSSTETHVNGSNVVDDAKPAEQVVMVGCWLAMKEVSLLLGTIIRKIPLPTCIFKESSNSESLQPNTTVLDMAQLETIGSHFMEVILKMKHNGAIDKTRAGFTALCNRLLCSNDPRLCNMTEAWMDQLMERTVSKAQTVDDLLRRSAGIPAAFIAFFLSEPEGAPKKLLPRALRWLIDIANLPLPLPNAGEINQLNGENMCRNSLHGASKPSQEMETDVRSEASKIRDEGVIPTVHAFNVLRAAFNDTNLAADTSGFSAEALIIAICSFSSPYWEIRNSACLAYTALVRRMIGFLNVQKRESARRALTGLEFFHRYPALHPFLLKELEIATESLASRLSEHLEGNIAKAVHPSLCPILILLSRLKPSTISSETEDSLDPFLLMPYIWKCSIQSNFRIRVLASRAITGLLSNEKLWAVLQSIANSLPRGRCVVEPICSTSSEPRDGVENEMSGFTSFNSIHGLLLQISSLLDNNCRNLIDISEKNQIIRNLTDLLVKCSWIGCFRLCPCPTLNASYLQVLTHMLSIARACGLKQHISVIGNMLLELSSECIDKVHSVSYDPTESELRSRAVVCYFNCIYAACGKVHEDEFPMQTHSQPSTVLLDGLNIEISVVNLQEKLVSCISDSSYEVRLATLKWLFQFLESYPSHVSHSVSICIWARKSLQSTLMQFLCEEKHPKCLYYILRIMYYWNLLQYKNLSNQLRDETIYVGNLDYNATFQFWGKLISLNKAVTNAKTCEMLLRCMGICTRQFTCFFRDSISSKLHTSEWWTNIIECINCFIFLVKKHSSSSEPVNMRKAAAESMVASGLLEEVISIGPLASNNPDQMEESQLGWPQKQGLSIESFDVVNLYAHGVLDLWFTCIKLLEDEDVGLRQRLALDIQQCFNFDNSSSGLVPAQVEKAIESSFCFMSSHFGHWIGYSNSLLRCVLDTGGFVVKGDLVRRVFDKEIDNHHEERLLICQLCCSQLPKLSAFKSLANLGVFVQIWRARFLNQLISFINDCLEVEGGNNWIGGLGNHKDAFISLYANLLGLYALSQNPFNISPLPDLELDESFLSEFIELTDIIQPFLKNPLISNLYFLVIQSYGKLLGPTWASLELKFRGNCPGWEDFHPFFLLR